MSKSLTSFGLPERKIRAILDQPPLPTHLILPWPGPEMGELGRRAGDLEQQWAVMGGQALSLWLSRTAFPSLNSSTFDSEPQVACSSPKKHLNFKRGPWRGNT